MSKVYDSPTTNLFDVLANVDEPKNKSKANASKAGQELTPKERAAAKAVQDAERKKEQEAEKARKAAAAERRKNIEVTDDTGFTQQRHQRIKEARSAPAEAKGQKSDKPKGPGNKTFPKGPKPEGSPKNVDKFKGPKGDNNKPVKTFTGKPDGKGPKEGNPKGEGKVFNNNKGGDNRPARGREFDKHSQGVNTRKPAAKKGGHGKGNWDKAVPAAEETAANAEATETTENKEVTDAAPAAEGEAQPEAAAATENKEEDEEEEGITLDEYAKVQEQKRKELEAKLGSTAVAQPRALSEDEQKALAKFTIVENSKAQKPAKPAATTAAPKKQNKGPIVLEINPQLPRVAGRDERKPRRFDNDGQPRRFDKEGGRGGNKPQQNKTRVAKPQKLPRGGNFDAQFPTL